MFLGLAVVSAALLFRELNHQSTEVVRGMALQGTAIQVATISAFRELYTTEVVTVARKHGLDVTHDYQGNPNAIPLPATLTNQLNGHIEKKRPGAHVFLYSDYPFPWRKPRDPSDTFAVAALQSLRRDPDQPYYRFEDFEGRPSLRFAIADRMKQSCVDCHNSHPDSPKRDWNVGDVRGVLEFVRPVDDAGPTNVLAAQNQLTGWLMVGAAFLGVGLIGLFIAIHRLRRSDSRAHAINADLRALNETYGKLFACRTASEVARILTEAMVGRFGAHFARVWLRRPADICHECALAEHCPGKRVPAFVIQLGLLHARRRSAPACPTRCLQDRPHRRRPRQDHLA